LGVNVNGGVGVCGRNNARVGEVKVDLARTCNNVNINSTRTGESNAACLSVDIGYCGRNRDGIDTIVGNGNSYAAGDSNSTCKSI
jgi:hypothetical protein